MGLTDKFIRLSQPPFWFVRNEGIGTSERGGEGAGRRRNDATPLRTVSSHEHEVQNEPLPYHFTPGMTPPKAWRAWRRPGYQGRMPSSGEAEQGVSHPGSASICSPETAPSITWLVIRHLVWLLDHSYIWSLKYWNYWKYWSIEVYLKFEVLKTRVKPAVHLAQCWIPKTKLGTLKKHNMSVGKEG